MSNEKFKAGDYVYLRYISTHDKYHNMRKNLLHRIYEVIEVSKVNHPRMTRYKHDDDWYKAILEVPGTTERYPFDLIQFRTPKIKEFEKSGIYVPGALLKPKIKYGDVSKINEEILYTIEEDLHEKGSTDKKFWKREYSRGKNIVCRYVGSGTPWFPVTDESFNHRDGSVEFKYKEEDDEQL